MKFSTRKCPQPKQNIAQSIVPTNSQNERSLNILISFLKFKIDGKGLQGKESFHSIPLPNWRYIV